jgi:hypothetical protein
MHQQRSVGRHRLGDAGDRLARQGAIERQHPLVGASSMLRLNSTVMALSPLGSRRGGGKGRGHGLRNSSGVIKL